MSDTNTSAKFVGAFAALAVLAGSVASASVIPTPDTDNLFKMTQVSADGVQDTSTNKLANDKCGKDKCGDDKCGKDKCGDDHKCGKGACGG